MRKNGTIVVLILVTTLFFASESFAQRGIRQRGRGGWGPGTPYGRMYNPNTVETIEGEVVRIEKITPYRGMFYGIHLILKTGNEEISVHLGPGWFFEKKNIKIDEKDTITVTGSRVTFQGDPVIIAAEVNKGDTILKLRDKRGFPVWSGWRRAGW